MNLRRASRRGQSRVESLTAILLFVALAVAAWALWREPIAQTNKAMVERLKTFLPGGGREPR